jgi:hypothetical protein
MAIQSSHFFVEIMYNSNSNSYTSNNSNSNDKVDTIRITHNSNTSIGNINEIVRVSSNPSINAKCV